MQCQALRTIPKTKLRLVLEDIDNLNVNDVQKNVLKKAYGRYFEANIPVKYWSIEMNDFKGDEYVKKEYENISKDLDKFYKNGEFLCFSGSFGLGKTTVVANILKRALQKGYSGLYLNLNDIISAMKSKESYLARKELIMTDFLVVDEFDPRYMATDAASDFYGRMLEDILRNRNQNILPLLMCTNSPNPTNVFSGILQESISSLFNYVDVIPVLGEDYRVKEKGIKEKGIKG